MSSNRDDAEEGAEAFQRSHILQRKSKGTECNDAELVSVILIPVVNFRITSLRKWGRKSANIRLPAVVTV